MTPDEAVTSIVVPAASGLVVGFAIGVITGIAATLRWVEYRRRQGKTVPIYNDADYPEPPKKRPWHSQHLSRMGILLMVAGILGLIGGTIGIVQSRSTAACLSTFLDQYSAASSERISAADLSNRAIRQHRTVTREFYRDMRAAIAEPATEPAERQRVRDEFITKFDDWDARLAEVDRLDAEAEQKRRANPLPAQPGC